MGANLKSDDDTLSMPSLSMVEEDDEEHEGSVDITDRLHEYLSSSSTSLIALSKSECVLDVKFWDVCSSIPVISIEECEDPIPIDPNLKDTTLSAALSVTNLAMEFLPVPPPSFHAPQPKPAVISWSRVSGCTFTQPPPRPQRARPLLSNVLRANQDGFRRSTRPSRGKENTSPLGSLSSISE